MPLPVEAVAAAEAEDAHWRSELSPRRRGPRPRSAPPRLGLAVQAPAPKVPLRTVCAWAGAAGQGDACGWAGCHPGCACCSGFQTLRTAAAPAALCALLGESRLPAPCPSRGARLGVGRQFPPSCTLSSPRRVQTRRFVWLGCKSTYSASTTLRFRKPVHPSPPFGHGHPPSEGLRVRGRVSPGEVRRWKGQTRARKRKTVRSWPRSLDDPPVTCEFLGQPRPLFFPALNPDRCCWREMCRPKGAKNEALPQVWKPERQSAQRRRCPGASPRAAEPPPPAGFEWGRRAGCLAVGRASRTPRTRSPSQEWSTRAKRQSSALAKGKAVPKARGTHEGAAAAPRKGSGSRECARPGAGSHPARFLLSDQFSGVFIAKFAPENSLVYVFPHSDSNTPQWERACLYSNPAGQVGPPRNPVRLSCPTGDSGVSAADRCSPSEGRPDQSSQTCGRIK